APASRTGRSPRWRTRPPAPATECTGTAARLDSRTAATTPRITGWTWCLLNPDMNDPRILPTADVDDSAELGAGTTVWHLAQIREDARLGRDCVIGRGAYVGPGVIIGDSVKLQNYALVYEPARLEDGVFIGPAVVLTNDLYPRSVDLSGKPKRPADWD